MTNTTQVENFDIALALFVDSLQSFMNESHSKAYPNLPLPVIEPDPGRRYVRIWKRDGAQRFAYCFIDKTNGDILKPASWKGPAKGKRGNIFNDNQLSGCNLHGVDYLR